LFLEFSHAINPRSRALHAYVSRACFGAVQNSEGSLLPANFFEKHGAMELSLKGNLNCVGKPSQEKLDHGL
jgi:hypothetical protein